MTLIAILLILFVLYGGFGVYGVRNQWYSPGLYGGSGVGVVIAFLVILYLLGYL